MTDAKCSVAQWQIKSHIATTTHVKLVARFREKVLAYSSIVNCLRRLHFGEDIFEPGIHSGKSSEGLVDFKILTERAVFSFHNMQTLAVSFVVKHLQWVPHRSDDVIKRARMTTAESLLTNFRQVRHLGSRCALAGDESRFFYATDYERISLPEEVIPQSRPRTMISTPKVMGSIFWSPLDLSVITRFRKEPNSPLHIAAATSFPRSSKNCHLTWEIHPDNRCCT
jgi:hypothetical protein